MTQVPEGFSVCQQSCLILMQKPSVCRTPSGKARSASTPTRLVCKSHGVKPATRLIGRPI